MRTTRTMGLTVAVGAALALAGGPRQSLAEETSAGASPGSAAGRGVAQAALTLENSFGGEHLVPYDRNVFIDAAKAKLALEASLFPALRFAVSVLGKDYRGATTLLADSYLPSETRASLVAPDPDSTRPGTVDLLAFRLERQLLV